MMRQKKIGFFILLFIVLNILNTFVITTQLLNRYIVSVDYTALSIINSTIGNLAFLLLVVLMIYMVTKKAKTQMLSMIIVSFMLNGILFAINIFNRYYGASFTLGAMSIFKNPADGVGMGIAFEAFKELITYYRIILFIPFIVLLILYLLDIKKKTIKPMRVSAKMTYAMMLLIILSFFSSQTVFQNEIKKEVVLDSTQATYAGQYLGIYQFHILEALGINFKNEYQEESLDEIIETLDSYNKNQEQYISLIDQKEYQVSPTKEEILDIKGKLIDAWPSNQSVTGILEDYNLVLIHLETFNHFLLEIDDINARLTYLNWLLSESYVMNQFYTNVGIGNSFDAEISVLTGLNANGTSNLAWDYDASKEVTNYHLQTLPKLFKQEAYDKVWSIHGDTEVFYNRKVVHPEVFGFDEYYAKEAFSAWYKHEDYDHDAGEWVSDRALFDFMNEQITKHNSLNEQFMMFGITMLPHVPFWYDPINDGKTDVFPQFLGKVSDQTIRYLNFMDYYDDLFKRLFFDENDQFIYHKKTAYLFYGDHGSGINNGDLDILYGLNKDTLSNIETRQKLLQTIAFLYIPDEDGTGMIKGNQDLVRGQTDLYASIIDLFNLKVDAADYIFGTHIMSQEKTFSIDNKTLDVIVDGAIFNLKNTSEYLIMDEQLTYQSIMTLRLKILTFKKYSDIAINHNLYDEIKRKKQSIKNI